MDASPSIREQRLPDSPAHDETEKTETLPPSVTAETENTAPVDTAIQPSTPVEKPVDPYAEQVRTVLSSEIGVQTLLNRLKQSVASAKEFALFLQRRARLEEDHANGLRKLARATQENLHKPDHLQGSFLSSYDHITRIHERMADDGSQYASSLHQMHEDILEMAGNVERGRKHWKSTGLAAEQRVVDAEIQLRKAKAKYDQLAEDYDKARTGDRHATKKFGLKGPKSAAQHEEDLLRKVKAADEEYAQRVSVAQNTRQEHLARGRPEAVKALQDLIRECDSGLSMQMQKFAAFSEKLLLHNGMSVSPLKGYENNQGRSLREVISDIDTEADLSHFTASYISMVPPRPAEIRYEQHPVLKPVTPPQMVPAAQRQSEPTASFGNFTPAQNHGGPLTAQPPYQQAPAQFQNAGPANPESFAPQSQPHVQHDRSYSQQLPSQPYGVNSGGRQGSGNNLPYSGPPQSSHISPGPPQLGALPFQQKPQQSQTPQPFPQSAVAAPHQGPMQPHQPQQYPQQQQQPQYPPQALPQPYSHQPKPSVAADLPPLRPVFGLTLDQLFERDGSAVPNVVYQCIQAVDLYGLEVEGIYRLSGTNTHVAKLRTLFDHDATKIDFRNPEAFMHDVNSVATLLKQFFRDLPDPLFTNASYNDLIEAAKVDDDIIRRDSLHAIINGLPDPNYATLRALTLHLHRVIERASVNRMGASNLAVVFGPTLMGMGGPGGNFGDSAWQCRVIQTVLDNCYQIFDDD